MDKPILENAVDYLVGHSHDVMFGDVLQEAYGSKSTITVKNNENATVNSVDDNGHHDYVRVFGKNEVSSQDPLLTNSDVAFADMKGKPIGTYRDGTEGEGPGNINIGAGYISFDGDGSFAGGGDCSVNETGPGSTVTCKLEIVDAKGNPYHELQTRVYDDDGNLTSFKGQITNGGHYPVGDFEISLEKQPDGTYQALTTVHKQQ